MNKSERELLHVGCGTSDPAKVPPCFSGPGWKETRLDIDSVVMPDIVADICDMSVIESGRVDGLFCSHNLEHLYAHDIPKAIGEFRRVLAPGGMAFIIVPDLQEVARLVVDGKIEEPAYISGLGPIAPIDIMYGHRKALAEGNFFMAHKTGFTANSLASRLIEGGFATVSVQRNTRAFSLWALAFVTAQDDAELAATQRKIFP